MAVLLAELGAVVSSLTGYPAPWVAEGIERSHVSGCPLPAGLESLPNPSLLPFGPPTEGARFLDPHYWAGAVRTFGFYDEGLDWSDEGTYFDR